MGEVIVGEHILQKVAFQEIPDTAGLPCRIKPMNVFHWHLTDDQGWRFPVDGYPELEEKAGKRTDHAYADGRTYGGFYSKEDIRDVVEFAHSRMMTVVPELECPGHDNPAIYVDGAHTVNSLKALVHSYSTLYPDGERTIIYGALLDKDHFHMCDLVLSAFDHIIISTPGTYKKSDIKAIYDVFMPT